MTAVRPSGAQRDLGDSRDRTYRRVRRKRWGGCGWRPLRFADRLRLAQLVACGALLASVDCAYYNGIYNARAASARADRFAQQQRDDSAHVWYRRSAEAAETVLARHAQSPWATEAYHLAARGRAFDGDCTAARAHWRAWLDQQARPQPPGGAVPEGGPAADAPRARLLVVRGELALAVCDLGSGRALFGGFRPEPRREPRGGPRGESLGEPLGEPLDEPRRARPDAVRAAYQRLQALDASADSSWPLALRVDVRRWHARAALAAGDPARAEALLRELDPGTAAWERLLAAAATGDWARVEQPLLKRVRDATLRPALDPMISALAAAGQLDRLERLETVLLQPGAQHQERARLSLLVGDVWVRTGQVARADSLFREVARRHSGDTLIAAPAAVRSLALQLRYLGAPDSLAPRLAQHAQRYGTGGGYDAVAAMVALFSELLLTEDPSGAALFLAGEVARDQLLAPLLARAAWTSLLDRHPAAPLAPRTLAALALLDSAQAEEWRSELQARYPDAAEARWLRGESIADAADYRAANLLLDGRWAIARRESSRAPQ